MDQVISQKTDYDDSTQALHINQAFTYTDEGKTKSVKTDSGTETTLKIDYTYDVKNNKAAASLEDGLFKTGFTYDNANNLSSIIYSKGSDTALSFSYLYDKTGNIIKETNRSGESQYVYDKNDQLLKEVLPNNTTYEYQYDKVGNRTKLLLNGNETTSYEYQNGNQIVKKNSISFTYDLDGNLLQDDNYKYTYNENGDQSSVKYLDNKVVAQYEYDEDGLRTKKIIGTKTYEYYYDGEDDNLAIEVTKENNQIQRYRFYQWDENGKVIGMIIKEKDSSGSWIEKAYYFLTNQRGDVVSIVDNNGSEVGSYTYSSFGNIISENGTIAKENFVRYASYYYDTETKHYYLKARYYDPSNGNFLALDSHPGDDDDPVSQNGYTYAGNSPVLQVDPDGDFFWMAVNVGFAAYDGYKAYKRGGWKKAAVAVGIGLVGGAAFKAVKSYRLARGASRYWYKGTYKSSHASMSDHHARHVTKFGRSYSQKRYTNMARAFYRSNKSKRQPHTLMTGKKGYKVVNGKRGGYYTKSGKIVTYWNNNWRKKRR